MRLTLDGSVGELGQRVFETLKPVVASRVVAAEVHGVGVVLLAVKQQRASILQKICFNF
jgi:hypothetical protein